MEFLFFLAMFLIILIVGHRIGYRAGIHSIPIERPWGDGKDLTGLLPLSDSKLRELEQWWDLNQSKDARIRILETQLRASRASAETYKDVALGWRDKANVVLPSGVVLNPVKVMGTDDPNKVTTLTYRGNKLVEVEQHREEPSTRHFVPQ